jgi:dTDP-4-dehydrorhamnose 3,5-epimerase
MTPQRPASTVPGVRYGAVARHADERGAFRELWRASHFGAIPPADAGAARGAAPSFTQANLSSSASGVLRGLHFHRRQLDYWVVASGRAFVALVDIRPMLQSGRTAPLVETRELVADEWVVIPSGVAHGFLAMGPLDLLYLVTNEYDGSDELGFAWDDPAAAVPWPAVAGAASCPTETDPTHPWLTSWCACATNPDPKGLARPGPSRD